MGSGLKLCVKRCERQATTQRQLEVGGKVVSAGQVQGVRPGPRNRLFIDDDGESAQDRQETATFGRCGAVASLAN